nr:unnamed protein product [Callosobruchus analis]
MQLGEKKKHICFMSRKMVVVHQMNVYSNSNSTLPDCFYDPNSINEYFIQSVEKIDTNINDDTLNYYPTHRISGETSKLHRYTDGTQVYIHFSKEGIHRAQHSLQSSLDKIAAYTSNHGLKLSSEKSQLIFFGQGHNRMQLHMEVLLPNDLLDYGMHV